MEVVKKSTNTSHLYFSTQINVLSYIRLLYVEPLVLEVFVFQTNCYIEAPAGWLSSTFTHSW